jgi:O-succinylbenzoate synthase
MELRLGLSDTTLQSSVHAAGEIHSTRTHIYLSIEDQGIRGLGEVSPQSTSLNGDPSVAEVLSELIDFALPQFQEVCAHEGAIPSWTRIARFAGPRSSSFFAVALIEMAVLDFELRKQKLRASEIWPPIYSTPFISTVSILDEVDWNLNEGSQRFRVKTSPGEISELQVERLRSLSKPVILDFNCSARNDDDVLSQVVALEGIVEIAAVEQPFAVGNVVDHARLSEQLDVAISLDEGVRSIRDLEQIARYSAAKLVCVKPSRVGGLANARTMIAKAQSLGIDAYIGGFFESEFARTVNRHLANACTDQPSDLGEVALGFGGGSQNFGSDDQSFGITATREFVNTLNIF